MSSKAHLTHTEACALVEDSLERVQRALAYVRLRLESVKPSKEGRLPYGECGEIAIRGLTDEANLLCNINWYGAYIQGARAALTRLEQQGLLNIPTAEGKSKTRERLANRAMLRLCLASARNLDWFIHEPPHGVEMRITYTLDKKGKATDAEAKFVKAATEYREI